MIEDRLRTLELDWPQTPAFSLADLPDQQPRRRRLGAFLAVAVLGAGVAVPDVRGQVLDWLGFGAVEVRVVDELPPLGPEIDLGRPVAPEAAARLRLPAPRSSRLGPAAYYVRGPILTARFADRRRAPLLVSVVRGDGLVVARKLVAGAGEIEHVKVADGLTGIWLKGVHAVNFLDEDGRFHEDELRLSASALIWNDGPLTYRLETSRPRAEALAAAASLR